MASIRMKFTFPTHSEAWGAMRAMDAAGLSAGYPEKLGLLVDVPEARKADAVDVGFGCGAYGYSVLGPTPAGLPWEGK